MWAGSVLFAGFAALVLAACGSSGKASPSATTTRPAIGVVAPAPPVYRDPSKPIRVPIGKAFALALPADPRSGLSWQPGVPPDPAVLLAIGSSFRSAPHGHGVEQVLLYAGRGYGTTQIHLRYASPRRGAPVLRAATFTVTVYDPSAPTTTTTTPSSTTTIAGTGVTYATTSTTAYTTTTTAAVITTTTTTIAPTTTAARTTTTPTTVKH